MADDVGSSHVRIDFGELSDAELVRATRTGSRRAYGALYARHSVSALKYAKTLTRTDADDVVSEAFLKVYSAIRAGKGPEEDFRFYIRSAVRNTYISMVRSRRTEPAGDAIEEVVGDRGADVASMRSFDGSATARAFLSLPSRWQEVLWYTEVEGYSREHTASLLGMNANAVSALSFRAREALRTAWLQEHISTHSDLDRGCEAITPLLGAYSRQGLSRRDKLRVEHHLNTCGHCTAVVDELSELLTPGRLALVLLPVLAAGGGIAAFASKFGTSSAVMASASAGVGAAAPPVGAVAVTLTGSGAASGAAALSVVGKVAACALVASLVVPPTQLLIEASEHNATTHSGTASEPLLDLATLAHETEVARLVVSLTNPTAPVTTGPSSQDDDAPGGDRGQSEHANAGGKSNTNPNANENASTPNPNASGGSGSTGNGGKSTVNPNANPNAATTGNGGGKSGSGAANPNSGTDGSANAGGSGKTNTNPNANPNASGTGSTAGNGNGNGGGNGNGNANGAGNGNGNANGAANGNGGGNGNGNGGGNGNANGAANGNGGNGAGNGNGNSGGNGNGGGNGNANGGGNGGGGGNGNANGSANGNGGGNGNGGNGNANGAENGNANGAANGGGNGNANGAANGNGNGNGGGNGNGRGSAPVTGDTGGSDSTGSGTGSP